MGPPETQDTTFRLTLSDVKSPLDAIRSGAPCRRTMSPLTKEADRMVGGDNGTAFP